MVWPLERSAGGSPVHLSARLQSVYDEFFNDAKQKRVMALAEKERRMAEMTMLMHNPPTAAQLKNMSSEEQAALKAAEHGNSVVLAAYLHAGGDPHALSRLHHMGWSLLHLAAGCSLMGTVTS